MCLLGRGHTKETSNRNATANSENCYRPELNTCYWLEQRLLRTRQRSFLNMRCGCQFSLFALALTVCTQLWTDFFFSFFIFRYGLTVTGLAKVYCNCPVLRYHRISAVSALLHCPLSGSHFSVPCSNDKLHLFLTAVNLDSTVLSDMTPCSPMKFADVSENLIILSLGWNSKPSKQQSHCLILAGYPLFFLWGGTYAPVRSLLQAP
jgi:hypothetical protein